MMTHHRKSPRRYGQEKRWPMSLLQALFPLSLSLLLSPLSFVIITDVTITHMVIISQITQTQTGCEGMRQKIVQAI